MNPPHEQICILIEYGQHLHIKLTKELKTQNIE